MNVFKQEGQFPICVKLNNRIVNKFTINAAKELADSIYKLLDISIYEERTKLIEALKNIMPKCSQSFSLNGDNGYCVGCEYDTHKVCQLIKQCEER
jgi:hypothetical protein